MRVLVLGLLGCSAHAMAALPDDEGPPDDSESTEPDTTQTAEDEGDEAAPEGEEAAAPEPMPEPESAGETVAPTQFASGHGYTRGSAYVSATTLFIGHVFHLNGEGRILPMLAASGGFGFGTLDLEHFTFKSSGGRILVHTITGKNKGHFEVAVGFGFYQYSVTEKVSGQGFSEEIQGSGPAYFVGYRFQPPSGGLVIRLGLANLAPGVEPPGENDLPLDLIPTVDLSGGYSF